jgi:hypothetical protein
VEARTSSYSVNLAQSPATQLFSESAYLISPIRLQVVDDNLTDLMCKPPSPFVVTTELAELARKLADWAAPATGTAVYLFGSRVRGDHKPDSDVDLCVEHPSPTRADIDWWTANTNDDFAAIATTLDARIELLERNSPIRLAVLTAPVVYQDRNVRCVWRKRHPKI